MTADSQKSCMVAPLSACNSATFARSSATRSATAAQPTALKALALKVLERNRQSNRDATDRKKPCNFSPKKDPQKLHKISGKLQPISGKNLPEFCSRDCESLIELHTPQGTFPGCRIETDRQISWMRLSFLKGCPEEMGESAMPFFPASEDFKGG